MLSIFQDFACTHQVSLYNLIRKHIFAKKNFATNHKVQVHRPLRFHPKHSLYLQIVHVVIHLENLVHYFPSANGMIITLRYGDPLRHYWCS